MDNQAQFRKLSDEYQALQTGPQIELQSAVHARQTLETQQQENTAVQKEFSALSPGANIYKLVGPILLRQDYSEATLAVNGRLSFIDKEIEKVEKQISDIQESSEKKKLEIYQLHVKIQPAS